MLVAVVKVCFPSRITVKQGRVVCRILGLKEPYIHAIVEGIQDTLMFHALVVINIAKDELQTLNFE